MRRLFVFLAPLLACSDGASRAPLPGLGDAAASADASAELDGGVVPGADGGDGGPTLAPLFAFVGSYDGFIRTYAVDAAGTWTAKKVVGAGSNPTFIAFDPERRRVVAIDDGATTVQAFTFDSRDGNLSRVSSRSAGASGPTHVSLDASGRWVFVAHYTAGSTTVRGLDASNMLGTNTDTKSSGAKSHWVGMNPSGTHVFVPALDLDAIVQYTFDPNTGKLGDNGNAKTPTKAGPRHLAFHPSEQWAYSINELTVTVTTFSFTKSTGKLAPVATISALPPGQPITDSTGAEIVMHPNGKWVYASTRNVDTSGVNSIAKFDVDPIDGTLTRISNTPTGGDRPRSFAIDPEGTLLFAGNEAANQVVGFRIDPTDGSLVALGAPLSVPRPGFVGLARMP